MEALVGFEPVAAIPVAAAFDQVLGALDALFHEKLVIEEDPDADDGEDKVDACAEDACLFEDGFEGGDGFILYC